MAKAFGRGFFIWQLAAQVEAYGDSGLDLGRKRRLTGIGWRS